VGGNGHLPTLDHVRMRMRVPGGAGFCTRGFGGGGAGEGEVGRGGRERRGVGERIFGSCCCCGRKSYSLLQGWLDGCFGMSLGRRGLAAGRIDGSMGIRGSV